jgi:hypothetical protein
VLFREGDRGQTMYVIRSGKVNISKRIGDSEIARRVLQARLAERRGSQDTGDAYGTYLALKQRFEYAEVDAS